MLLCKLSFVNGVLQASTFNTKNNHIHKKKEVKHKRTWNGPSNLVNEIFMIVNMTQQCINIKVDWLVTKHLNV